jgi:hypothetical protein
LIIALFLVLVLRREDRGQAPVDARVHPDLSRLRLRPALQSKAARHGPADGKRLAAMEYSQSNRPRGRTQRISPLRSIDRSPCSRTQWVAAIFEHEIGIRFNGKLRNDGQEYCISEGWVKVPAGKTMDRKG